MTTDTTARANTPWNARNIVILLSVRGRRGGDAVDRAHLRPGRPRLHLLAVFRIERLGHAERRIAWHAPPRRHLVHEWILLGNKVRHALPRRMSLVRRHARRSDRREFRGLQLEALRQDLRLRKIEGIFDQWKPRQEVAVTIEPRRQRRLVAQWRPCLPDEVGFHVRRVGAERVALPVTRRETAAR